MSVTVVFHDIVATAYELNYRMDEAKKEVEAHMNLGLRSWKPKTQSCVVALEPYDEAILAAQKRNLGVERHTLHLIVYRDIWLIQNPAYKRRLSGLRSINCSVLLSPEATGSPSDQAAATIRETLSLQRAKPAVSITRRSRSTS